MHVFLPMPGISNLLTPLIDNPWAKSSLANIRHCLERHSFTDPLTQAVLNINLVCLFICLRWSGLLNINILNKTSVLLILNFFSALGLPTTSFWTHNPCSNSQPLPMIFSFSLEFLAALRQSSQMIPSDLPSFCTHWLLPPEPLAIIYHCLPWLPFSLYPQCFSASKHRLDLFINFLIFLICCTSFLSSQMAFGPSLVCAFPHIQFRCCHLPCYHLFYFFFPPISCLKKFQCWQKASSLLASHLKSGLEKYEPRLIGLIYFKIYDHKPQVGSQHCQSFKILYHTFFKSHSPILGSLIHSSDWPSKVISLRKQKFLLPDPSIFLHTECTEPTISCYKAIRPPLSCATLSLNTAPLPPLHHSPLNSLFLQLITFSFLMDCPYQWANIPGIHPLLKIKAFVDTTIFQQQ